MTDKTPFHLIFGKFYGFIRQQRAEAALEELQPLVRRAEKLAYKGAFDGSRVLQECKSLQASYDLKLLTNSRIARLLSSNSANTSKVDACSRYFGTVFFDVTSFSRPFRPRVFDYSNTDVKKAAAKLLAAFIRTCQGRTMALQGRIEALKYQEELVNLWLEHPPTLPQSKDQTSEQTAVAVYRGVSYRVNNLEGIVTFAAQAQHLANGMKNQVDAGIAQIQENDQSSTSPVPGATRGKILRLISLAPRSLRETLAAEILGMAELIEARVTRFFQCEEDLGNLTAEEFTRVLEARQHLAAAYIDCLKCSAVAHKAQIDSTQQLIELSQALLAKLQ